VHQLVSEAIVLTRGVDEEAAEEAAEAE
jgi:hypothetical protein